MKTIIIILFFAYMPIFARAQNVVQAEYFLDADAGFGQNKLVNFTPVADGSFPFTVDLAGVAPGFHKLYIRTKDSNGKWSVTSRRNIEVLASEAANKIVSGEYYFNADPGFGVANVISVSPPDSVILQNFTAAVSSLGVGYHKLYGRFKDTYGNWSLTFRRNVEVVKGIDNAVMLVEYFFDKDPSFGNAPSTTFANPLPDGSFAFNIPANQVVKGADTLFVRVKDSTNGDWSITSYRIGQITLPLTLLDFNATLTNNTTHSTWQTTNEINTAYFTIERSIDGVSFKDVGKVNAKGNTTTLNIYGYDDDIAGIANNKIYYRLKQEDKDGRIAYSKVVVINIGDRKTDVTITPNPARNLFTINTDGNVNFNNSTLFIRDLSGQTVLKQNLFGNGAKTIDISRLVKGVYVITIVTSSKTYTEKLLVE
jgi:hypothetical protein